MPVFHDGSLYNCRVLLLNQKVLAIRPKTRLADNGNYRESRWFTAWTNPDELVWFNLPQMIRTTTGQQYVPFGANFVLQLQISSHTYRIGFEMCEELWQTQPTHETLFGRFSCDLVCNGSASYWEIRKLNRTRTLIESASGKCGGAYAYSNLIGCDGSRLCFYGRSALALNGKLVNMNAEPSHLFDETHVMRAFIDSKDVIAYRRQNNIRPNSERQQAPRMLVFHASDGYNATLYHHQLERSVVIIIDHWPLTKHNQSRCSESQSDIFSLNQHLHISPEREIALFASLWLWDYLRRCGFAVGFIVPLSGGLDSAAVATLVCTLSDLLARNIHSVDVQREVHRITGLQQFDELTDLRRSICSRLLRCVYLRCVHSGSASEQRARALAEQLGAQFTAVDYSTIYQQATAVAQGNLCDFDSTSPSPASLNTPTFTLSTATVVPVSHQNLQARLRMVFTYLFSNGNRLVLATGNVDEALVGYLTKYDCSAADLNPIGSLSKRDLRQFVQYVQQLLFATDLRPLQAILDAIPSAELSGESQADEIEIGLTYEELGLFGSVRRGDLGCYGPYGMFCKLWDQRVVLAIDSDATALASKVKRFFSLHARNRHKQAVLTPALHSVSYSPDDNRFDHRQLLFAGDWSWQYRQIDQKVIQILKQEPLDT